MKNNADTMRHVIIVLIALLALSIFMPTIWAKSTTTGGVLVNSGPALTAPADTPLTTTASQADFLNDSWVPSSFVAPTIVATGALKNGTLRNATYGIYDFANDNWVPPTSITPSYTAVSTNNAMAATGAQSSYQFLDPNWTPATPVQVTQTGVYQQHVMS